MSNRPSHAVTSEGATHHYPSDVISNGDASTSSEGGANNRAASGEHAASSKGAHTNADSESRRNDAAARAATYINTSATRRFIETDSRRKSGCSSGNGGGDGGGTSGNRGGTSDRGGSKT